MSSSTFSLSDRLKGNRFAPLAEPDVDERLEAQRKAEAQKHAPKSYTMPKLDLFGADVPETSNPRTVFGKALQSGYRGFDTASAYGTIDALAETSGQGKDQLYVIYKVKPADDHALKLRAQQVGGAEGRQIMRGTVAAQLSQATEALGRQPDILMLHELGSDTANEKTLKQLSAVVKAGQAKGIGLSNVNLEDLKALAQRAKALGCPIKCVENRFSPYHRDDDVRSFCAANNIRYVGYGLMGSTQTGACVDEGYGSPTQYLLPRRDPRLAALAEEVGVSTGELLLAWAYAKDVVPVAFSTDGDRIQSNHDARKNPKITEDVLGQLDALFVRLPRGALSALETSARPEGLKALHRAFPDPTMWSILDTLGADQDIAGLLASTASGIADAAPLGQRDAALKNFALNLMRHVGDLQSAGIDDWAGSMTPGLKEVARAAQDRPEVAARFAEWATKNSALGGGFVDATTAFPTMLAVAEVAPVGPQTIDLGQGWKVFADATFAAEVAPEVGKTYQFYRQTEAGYDTPTGRVEGIQGQQLRVTFDA
jgi:diketogulonate reductase-like aldo/keto reductase